MTEASILLPWTKPPLSLNHRQHHMATARTVKQVRGTMLTLARAHRLPTGVQHVTVTLHYQPADNRRRDTDNLVATLKPLCDALTDPRLAKGRARPQPGYGMVPDDTPQWMSKPEPVIHPAVPGRKPRLWLHLQWEQP